MTEVKIKKLKFMKRPKTVFWDAKTPVGTFSIYCFSDKIFTVFDTTTTFGFGKTLELAKDKAQRIFERRVKQCLENK